MIQQITIIGSQTLLGKHLISTLSEIRPQIKQKFWDYHDDLLAGLDEALEGSDIVFNLHEVQDFSLMPNIKRMQEHNVDFLFGLLSRCIYHRCAVIVHLSTIYLQCSTKWPNIYGREQETGSFERVYRAECPYPEYCDSKFQAEKLIAQTDKIGRVIARVGPLYGEWDTHSAISDAILALHWFDHIPKIGWDLRDLGALQFTYAKNAAHALLQCADKLQEEKTTDGHSMTACETVVICDNTPVQNFYSLLDDLGLNDGNGNKTVANESSSFITTNFKQWHIPFTVFYIFYWFLCIFVSILKNIFGIQHSLLNKLPAPNYVYLLLRHWTSYSDYKLRIFFDFKPPYDWATSRNRSLVYYNQLKFEQIQSASWLPNEK